MSFFKRKVEALQVKCAEKQSAKALEEVFGESLADMQSIFSHAPAGLKEHEFAPWPGVRYLGEDYGIHAFAQTHHIENAQFPVFYNMVRSGRHERAHFHFVREHDGQAFHTIISQVSKFSGRDVRVLSNDVELIEALDGKRFAPPPPWIALYEFGPVLHLSQGDEHYWLNYVWDRYWESLSLEEQDSYLARARKKTVSYIPDEDWEIWVEAIRMRDARYRQLEN